MFYEAFDTGTLPLSRQFEAWNQWYGPIFDTTPLRPAREGYAARHLTWCLDGFAISQVVAPATNGSRTKALIRRNPIDHWVVSLIRRGTYRFSTRDVVVAPGTGVPFVQSLADPTESERSDFDRVQLYLARDDFHEIATELDAVRDVILENSFGRLLAEFLVLLERGLPTLPPDHAPRLKNAVKAMVAACVNPSLDRLVDAKGPIDISRLSRVRRVVAKYLRSPALDAGLLCREVGLSRSGLYRLLEDEGGVSRYIQRRRLAAAYSTLADTTNTRSITEIALDLCFSNPSTFSRAFRREFGIPPNDVRTTALDGATQTSTSGGRTETGVTNFGDLIRRI